MLRLVKKLFTRRLAMRLMAGFAIGVLAMGATGAVSTNVAFAAEDTDCSGIFCSVFEGFGNVIATLINAVSELVGHFIQLLADGIIDLIGYSTRVVEMPAVQAGFQVSLGIVNLMFVMALIIVSFQIILGVHEGEAKKQLVNVIIAAILVNFSLLIAGLLLDISNIFTVFFMDPVTSDNIRIALNPDQFRAITELSSGGGFFAAVMPALFSLVMSFIILIVLIAVFATVLVRLLWVACLLMVMPLTWAFWVFPGLEKYHKEWWGNFIKWGVVVLPSMTFFMYLSIMTVNQMAAWTGAKAANQTIQGTLGGILQMLIIGGIMIAGIKIGQAAGGVTASAAIGAARTAAGFAAKPIMGNKYSKAGGRAVSGWASKQLTKLNNVPYLGAATSAIGLGTAANKLAQSSHAEHDIEEFQKGRLGDMSDDQLFSFRARGGVEQSAKLAELAKRKKTEKFLAAKNPNGTVNTALAAQRLTEVTALAKAYKSTTHKAGKDIPEIKELVSLNPQLAPQLYGVTPQMRTDPVTGAPIGMESGAQATERTIRDATNKSSTADMAKRDPGVYNPATAEGRIVLDETIRSNANLRAVVNMGSKEHLDGLKSSMTQRMNSINPAVQASVSTQNAAILKAERDTFEARRNGDAGAESLARTARGTAVTARNTAIATLTSATAQAEMQRLVSAQDKISQIENRDSNFI